MTIDGEVNPQSAASGDEPPEPPTKCSAWRDLLALLAILSTPTVLILVGHADAAALVASSEFVVAVFLAWRRGTPT